MKIGSTVRNLLLASCIIGFTASLNAAPRMYEIWEPAQAPNSGGDFETVVMRGYPYDEDWEAWSYPIGNGYMGASLFGRVDTERIQITKKHIHNVGCYGFGGLTGFAELYLDFNHEDVSNYRRSLNLNEAVAYVSYEKDGVKYTREYFMSYPDNVLVVQLKADKKGALSFTVRPEVAYLDREDRTGSVVGSGDLITLSGQMSHFNINYEAQVKVLHEGGTVNAGTGSKAGQIEVTGADSVTLIMAAGTNYELYPGVFIKPPKGKLDPNQFPHDEVSALISSAVSKGFDGLRKTHIADYQNLFDRVAINLNSTQSQLPTHELLANYKASQDDTYLEELMFQYARYLLIASSREKSLPANLQGTWSQYYFTPWSGGYWHNINVQMNYWGAMSANLSETFLSYINYYKAYLPQAEQYATDYVKKFNPERLSDKPGGNGWIIGSGSNPYYLPIPGAVHSGPGTGGFTAKLMMDYYEYTQDEDYLMETGYPALREISRFFSKALIEQEDGTLLVQPSASPEQKIENDEQLKNLKNLKNPGYVSDRGYYLTTGCTFDQGFVWECFNDTLVAAKALGETDAFLGTIRDEIKRLDPIHIGASGQIKEFREEINYSDIGDPKHRHISHLCPLYPGTLINSDHEEWMQAASKTLDLRGDEHPGWAMAHHMNCRARLKDSEKAHELYRKFISERTLPNLWTLQPPFQVDGSLGTMAGVVEMLLQSHEEYIEILPALPKAWNSGSFDGLVARGNFVISAQWENGKATALSITSRSGGECRLAYPCIESVKVKDSSGEVVQTLSPKEGKIKFDTEKGKSYTMTFHPSGRSYVP